MNEEERLEQYMLECLNRLYVVGRFVPPDLLSYRDGVIVATWPDDGRLRIRNDFALGLGSRKLP